MLHKNLTPFQFGTKVTSRRPPQAEMTVFVRACYRLTPGQPLEPIADMLEQGQLSGDQWHDDDENLTGELKRISDFADYLPTAEVLLTGSCHTPGGQPQPQCPVRFRVGDWEKQLLVTGPRVWKGAAIGYTPGDPQSFTSLPLTWANAFGGPEFPTNPAGKGAGTLEMPCVEYPDRRVTSPDHGEPASFTGLSPHWPQRAGKRGRNYGADWKRNRSPFYADDFDWSYFHAAPPDQRLPEYLRGDEVIELQNLHPESPLVQVSLPGTRVRVFWMNDEEAITEVDMVADQLRVAPDENRVWLMWRGLTPVQDIDLEDVAYVLVASEEAGDEARPDDWYHEQLRAFAADPIGIREAMPAGLMEASAAYEQAEDEGRSGAAVATEGLAADGEGNPLSDFVRQQLGGVRADQQQIAESMINEHAAAWTSAGAPTDRSFNSYLAEGLQNQGASAPPPTHIALSGALRQLAGARMQLAQLGHADEAIRTIDSVFENPGVKKMLGPLDGRIDYLDDAASGRTDADRIAAAAEAGGDARRDLVGADFSGQDLRGQSFANCDLAAASFADADISGCDFTNSDLSGAHLYRVTAAGTDFTGCDFNGALLDRARLEGAVLRDCRIANAGFHHARMKGAVLDGAKGEFIRFTGADLTGASCIGLTTDLTLFDESRLDGADFSRAHLTQTSLHFVSAVGINFDGATIEGLQCGHETDLTDAHITNARADGAVFRDAKLVNASFADTSLKRAIFNGANLVGARFIACDLSSAMMRKAGLEKAQFSGCKLFRAELVLARCVDTVFADCNLYGAVMFDTMLANCTFPNTSRAHVMTRESE